MFVSIIIIVGALILAQWNFRRDFSLGVGSVVFLLVLLPTEVRLDMPGALPELTAHRVILLFFFLKTLRHSGGFSIPPKSVILTLLWLIAVERLMSSLVAEESAASFKTLFGYLIETVLYFKLVLTVLTDRRTISCALWSSLFGFVIISGIAIVEKYRGINLAAMAIPGMADFHNTVSATFRHRILLGYAMAMAFPLVVVMQGVAQGRAQRWFAWLGMFSVVAACYFGNSRGPWVGLALGLGVMLFMGGASVVRRLRWVIVLTLVVLVARPGIFETIANLWQHSFDETSLKGRSASYRLRLWQVAYNQLRKSPERLVLGYGGSATRSMDLGDEFERGSGGTAGQLGHTSWDSQYASNFLQYGTLGLLLELILYFAILRLAFRAWWAGGRGQREIAAACLASIGVFIWAMSNVAIFSPQLQFIFWTFVAIAERLSVFARNAETGANDALEDGEQPAPAVFDGDPKPA